MEGSHELGKTTSAYARGSNLVSRVMRRCVEASNSRTPFVEAGQYGKLKPGRHLSLSRAPMMGLMMRRIVACGPVAHREDNGGGRDD